MMIYHCISIMREGNNMFMPSRGNFLTAMAAKYEENVRKPKFDQLYFLAAVH